MQGHSAGASWGQAHQSRTAWCDVFQTVWSHSWPISSLSNSVFPAQWVAGLTHCTCNIGLLWAISPTRKVQPSKELCVPALQILKTAWHLASYGNTRGTVSYCNFPFQISLDFFICTSDSSQNSEIKRLMYVERLKHVLINSMKITLGWEFDQ